jgi:hypothetical protein
MAILSRLHQSPTSAITAMCATPPLTELTLRQNKISTGIINSVRHRMAIGNSPPWIKTWGKEDSF